MRNLLRTFARGALLLWASPYTLLGISVGLVGLMSGGKVQFRRGVVEFYGGFVAWWLRRLPTGPTTAAMTLGHSILGQTTDSLDFARDHEHVHVRQFERWGPLMGPLYLGASVYVWLKGGRAYRDNPFEVEAYDAVPRGKSKPRPPEDGDNPYLSPQEEATLSPEKLTMLPVTKEPFKTAITLANVAVLLVNLALTLLLILGILALQYLR